MGTFLPTASSLEPPNSSIRLRPAALQRLLLAAVRGAPCAHAHCRERDIDHDRGPLCWCLCNSADGRHKRLRMRWVWAVEVRGVLLMAAVEGA